MKRWYALLVVAILTGAAFSLTTHITTIAANSQAEEAVIPLDGLDPVLLAQGKEVPGKTTISVIRGQYKYLFATEENKTVFEA